jgi:hypothetical protein
VALAEGELALVSFTFLVEAVFLVGVMMKDENVRNFKKRRRKTCR